MKNFIEIILDILKTFLASLSNEPDRPTVKDPDEVTPRYTIPKIVEVDVDMPTQGKYRTSGGKAIGLVVHYTAGRSKSGESDAIRCLQGLAKRGLGCLAMDINGVIYKAKTQGWDDVAWHAGSSAWDGKTGMSRYYMGMEICNAGKLDNNMVSWFGEKFTADEVRVAEKDYHNIDAGKYPKYTVAQEESLKNFILWRMDLDPNFKTIVGHDEISKSGKTDPGASLSMSMPEYRAMIEAAR